MVNRDLLSPCGLYCGVCGAYIATQKDSPALKAGIAQVFGCAPEEINCQGCRSSVRYKHCQSCAIRSCAEGRGYEGCHQCAEFPCGHIEALGAMFPNTVAHKVMLRAVEAWRKLGTEAWVAAEEARYRCPSCQQSLMRGAARCHRCGQAVILD
ncbi:MAG: DUF3795 domain-containing protein [Desulfarculus sp.]|jgi:hypothetical protein|nr:MAG: DUF3795 domain-containing protein [Desulfarculus sp.]